MRQQRMLREELRDKKKELEDMMRKEHALKQNSRNQDTQSDVISYSNKSDLFGSVLYSVLSPRLFLYVIIRYCCRVCPVEFFSQVAAAVHWLLTSAANIQSISQ